MNRRTLVIGACVLSSFVLILFFEFNSWFYNNEMPAYLRAGVLSGNASGAIKAFYEASRDACPKYHPELVGQCETYLLALLAEAPYVRPIASAAGVLLSLLVAYGATFMQALKFAILGLAVGAAILCALMLLPFLAILDRRALTAIGLVWVAGWIGTRPLHTQGPVPNIILAALALTVVALGIQCIRARRSPQDALRYRVDYRQLARFKPALTFGLGLFGIALCFWLGYRLHLVFGSRYPLLYLLLAIGLWPLLDRVLPAPGSWALSGLLSSTLYLMATLVPTMLGVSLAKQHLQLLVGMMIFISIWRDDARVFWALPLLLIFDMQNASRLCALVIVVEGTVGIVRREVPIAVAPAALTAIIALVTMSTTVVYPFDARLYNISDVLAVLRTPETLTAGLVSVLMIVFAAHQPSRHTTSPVALDRMFVYAASVVAMAGIHIPTRGFLFDAFQLSTIFISVAVAPTVAVLSGIVGLFLKSYENSVSELDRRCSIAAIAALLLLMSTTRGKNITLTQLSEGTRSAISKHFPDGWLRHRTPYMTLQDNVVYLHTESLMTSALMQYSLIKILVLSRNSKLENQGITVLPFGR